MYMSTEELVLRALLSSEKEISRDEIARELNISPNAVIECIERLRGDGIQIEQTSEKGYSAADDPNIISWARIRRSLRSSAIQWSPEIYLRIDSTNNRGKESALSGAPHGTLIIADSQTAGRGRFGRRFHSPKGSGVYLSAIFRPQLTAERAVMLTSMAAVAVARAIEAVAEVHASIKWVNDVYIGDKKVCGILCESGLDFANGRMKYVVVGIGVNIAKTDFPDEIKNIATSVSNECGVNVDRNRFIAELLNQLDALYPQLESGAFMKEGRSRSNVIGRHVIVLQGGKSYRALATDIDDNGSLIVIDENGDEQTLHSGEVSLRFE